MPQPPSDPHKRRSLLTAAQQFGALGLASLGLQAAQAQPQTDPTDGDPLGSMQWPVVRRKVVGDAAVALHPGIAVLCPPTAEDAMNVPLMVDARGLLREGHAIERIVVVADRNPVQQIVSYLPHRARPVLALRFRLEQSSPVRALVRTQAGQWFTGHTWVNAAGGGCTVPGVTRSDGSWARQLNQVHSRLFMNVLDAPSARLRVQVMHPMDTGLAAGIPAFHLETLELHDAAQQLWCRLELHEPVSENPLLTFEFDQRPPGTLLLTGQDNNGNRLQHEIRG